MPSFNVLAQFGGEVKWDKLKKSKHQHKNHFLGTGMRCNESKKSNFLNSKLKFQLPSLVLRGDNGGNDFFQDQKEEPSHIYPPIRSSGPVFWIQYTNFDCISIMWLKKTISSIQSTWYPPLFLSPLKFENNLFVSRGYLHSIIWTILVGIELGKWFLVFE